MANERHPVQERPQLSAERRCQLLEQQLAQVWDQVWWMNLPFWRRWWYIAQGFRSPISRFYQDVDGD